MPGVVHPTVNPRRPARWIGIGLLAGGAIVAASSRLLGPVDVPLVSSWHLTLFPMGVGLLLAGVGAAVLIASIVRR